MSELSVTRPTSSVYPTDQWTPPSGCGLYWISVKHRIADFIDWVCSPFCGSKIATKDQIEDALKKDDVLRDEIGVKKFLYKRYKGANASSENDVYRYLADHVERLELAGKITSIVLRWKENVNSGVVLTERQLRAEARQLIELRTSMGIFARSTLPEKTTSAMRDKVRIYSLGQLTFTKGGKAFSLVDKQNRKQFKAKFSPELADQTEKLIKKIRSPVLIKFKPQWLSLNDPVNTCCEKVTLQDLADESQAVHVLAHRIEVEKQFQSLNKQKGNISEESLMKRFEKLKNCASHAVGQATSEMRKTVREFDFSKTDVANNICAQTWNYMGKTDASKPIALQIRGRLKEVIDAVQKPNN